MSINGKKVPLQGQFIDHPMINATNFEIEFSRILKKKKHGE